MKKTFILFFASFATVFSLGFQSLNVVNYYYGYAFLTSLVISWSSFYLYKIVPSKEGLTWYEFTGYCLGGALGVVLGMFVHQRFI